MDWRRAASLTACLLVIACSARTASDDEVADTAPDESGTDESGTDESDVGETGVVAESCACIVSNELVCDDALRPTALYECDVPSPCGVVNLQEPDAEIASCVLQLLVDQATPSRFDYVSPMYGGWGNGLYIGTFYILGTGTGIDLACEHPSWDCCSPPPPVPMVAHHAINDPAYFLDCLGESDTVMTGCIFNGLELSDPVPVCAGP